LCSALAAVHEQGLLHRDLKPANVMLDGRGKVRLTDFGLAAVAEDLSVSEVRSGTPLYQSPEQLAGREVTVRSDLYALGLVLYELFTGKRAFVDASRDNPPSKPSSHVSGLARGVEGVILDCLAPDPADRPRSAAEVLARLPGGDPLAAALAAGETPSPEMVAAGGKKGTLSLVTGGACLAVTLAALVALPFVAPTAVLVRQSGVTPQGRNPEKLEGILQDNYLSPLGYFDPGAPPEHAVHGLRLRKEPNGKHGEPRLEFWYRQRSRGYLTPTISHLFDGPRAFTLSISNPPPHEPGMVTARLDMNGNLIELLAVLEDDSTSSDGGPEVSDRELYAWAGLKAGPGPEDIVLRVGSDAEQAVQPDEPLRNWEPPVYADDVIVYEPKADGSPGRVVIGRNRGRLVYFHAGSAGGGDSRQLVSARQVAQSQNVLLQVISVRLLNVVVLFAAIFLALRNLRLGRANSRGALRFATTLGLFWILLWPFAFHHVSSLPREVDLAVVFLLRWIGLILRFWLYYLALEPYVRRYWPDVLIAWTRALDGRFRDPLLGREVLVGCLTGAVLAHLLAVLSGVSEWSGSSLLFDLNFDPDSSSRVAATLCYTAGKCLYSSVWSLLILFLWRLTLRDARLAVIAFTLYWMAIPATAGATVLVVTAWGVAFIGFAWLITRFGLLAGCSYWFAYLTLSVFLVTPDLTAWYGMATLVPLVTVAAVALYGFYTSTLAALPAFGAQPSGVAREGLIRDD
jgi:hypothetical protein